MVFLGGGGVGPEGWGVAGGCGRGHGGGRGSPSLSSQPSRSGLKKVWVRSLPSSSGILKGSLRMLSYRFWGGERGGWGQARATPPPATPAPPMGGTPPPPPSPGLQVCTQLPSPAHRATSPTHGNRPHPQSRKLRPQSVIHPPPTAAQAPPNVSKLHPEPPSNAPKLPTSTRPAHTPWPHPPSHKPTHLL